MQLIGWVNIHIMRFWKRRHYYGEPRRRRHPKLIAFIALAVFLILLVLLVVRGLTGPAEGTLSQTPPSQAQKVIPYRQPGTYKGKYITFTYPEHYRPTTSKLSGSYLEVANYTSTDQSFKNMAVGVYKGSLSSDGSLNYRQQHPELYSHTTSKLGIEFVKLDGTEDTFFLQHNDLLATVSVTSQYKNLNSDALYVASGLHWR